MKKQTILLACFTAGAFLLTGCSNNAQTGALVGSLVGAGLGKSTSNHRDRRAGVGAILGGIVGSAIGAEKDRANRSRSVNNQAAYTTPYYQNGTSSKVVTQNSNGSHKHGNRTHTHPGGTGNHTHNYNQQTTQTYQAPQQVVVHRPEYKYVDPYPVHTSVVIGGGYYNRPRYRNYRRHNHRRYNHRNYHKRRNHFRRY